MFERSWSDGISERSANLSASSKRRLPLDAVRCNGRRPAEEHVGALDIREGSALTECAGLLEQCDRLADLAAAHSYGRFTGERTRLELLHAGGQHGSSDALELLERLVIAAGLEQGVRTRKRCIDTAALIGRDAVRQKACVDAEPLREPIDRLVRGTGLAPLDLVTYSLENRSPARSV